MTHEMTVLLTPGEPTQLDKLRAGELLDHVASGVTVVAKSGMAGKLYLLRFCRDRRSELAPFFFSSQKFPLDTIRKVR